MNVLLTLIHGSSSGKEDQVKKVNVLYYDLFIKFQAVRAAWLLLSAVC
ncbi:hypothetical protein [Cytobacillus pseudoceanisediminis]|nr:hypothetical protein [Cytobacillus oceanisediminis]